MIKKGVPRDVKETYTSLCGLVCASAIAGRNVDDNQQCDDMLKGKD